MSEIKRHNIDQTEADEYAYSEIVEAGDFVFLTFCPGSGATFEEAVNSSLDCMSVRLEKVGLTLESVLKLDVLMYDRANIPIMEKVFKERFKGKYPARKVIATEFAHRGKEEPDSLHVQIDAVAYRK